MIRTIIICNNINSFIQWYHSLALTFTVEDSVSIMEGSTQSVCVTANLPAGGLETTFNVTPIITNQQAMG